MLAEAREKHARECATGRSKRCDGIAATIRVYEDAIKGNAADLTKLSPPIPVALKAEKMAALAAIFGHRQDPGESPAHSDRVICLYALL